MAEKKAGKVCVIGQGFVGLPLAVAFAQAGEHVIGIDSDSNKISSLQAGTSYIKDVSDYVLQELMRSKSIEFATEFNLISEVDAILICVPTPLDDQNTPDMTYVVQAASAVSKHLSRGQLIVLESSTFPGTTENLVIPILESSGLKDGEDFYVAYSPERINPGDQYELKKIPKIVGGTTKESLEKALNLYHLVFERVVPVSSTRVAELTKILENTQRFVNISMMNELAVLCHHTGMNLWEAIDAAATKPYGFVPYYPGPGIGGHCIPVDPMYLSWYATQSKGSLELIELGHKINDEMPQFVAGRIMKLTTTQNPRILLVGITYKRDVQDLRESASLRVWEALNKFDAAVEYHDPLVPSVHIFGKKQRSIVLTSERLEQFDVVAILTDHSAVQYEQIQHSSKIVLDCRRVYKENYPNVNLL